MLVEVEAGVHPFEHGADETEQGMLMSMAAPQFDAVGLFHARIIASIFTGVSPRSLPMVFVDEPKIAINVGTAQAMGLNLPADVLAGADQLLERSNDLVVNPTKAKQLTNIRAAGSDENLVLTPPIRYSLEQSLEFLDDDELLEVTPTSLRLRKKHLKESDRKREARQAS